MDISVDVVEDNVRANYLLCVELAENDNKILQFISHSILVICWGRKRSWRDFRALQHIRASPRASPGKGTILSHFD